MRDFAPSQAPRLEARSLRIGRNGGTLLNVNRLVLDRPGPTLILGPNGAGKSLLLRCLHGLIVPDDGQVMQDGAPLDPAGRGRQAMVFQRPVLLRRSVAGNLAFVLRRRGLPRAERQRRLEALLEQGGFAGRARQPARSLSGGEAQRLAILRALACDPQILFLDEPSSALDPAATQAIEALVRGAAEAGTRVVMVTHDIGQARRLGQDIVLMHRGEVIEHSDAAAFFESPESHIARRFLAGALVL